VFDRRSEARLRPSRALDATRAADIQRGSTAGQRIVRAASATVPPRQPPRQRQDPALRRQRPRSRRARRRTRGSLSWNAEGQRIPPSVDQQRKRTAGRRVRNGLGDRSSQSSEVISPPSGRSHAISPSVEKRLRCSPSVLIRRRQSDATSSSPPRSSGTPWDSSSVARKLRRCCLRSVSPASSCVGPSTPQFQLRLSRCRRGALAVGFVVLGVVATGVRVRS
jgi:hypothetical protein